MERNETEKIPSRTEALACDGPAELVVQLRTGRLDVRAVGAPGIRVGISVDRGDATKLEQALEGTLDRISGGEYSPTDAELQALSETRVTFSEERRRLVIATPRSFRRVGLAVTVELPEGSRVAARIHRGSMTASGLLGSLSAATGSGDIRAEHVGGDADLATGSGDLRLGRVAGRLRTRTGSGEIEIASLDGGEAKLTTGSGGVWLGAVRSDVHARTGRGNVVVAEVASGRLDLVTASGNVNVSVRPGVSAEIDLASGSGRARSELDVAGSPPPEAPLVRIRARTGSGDAVVAAANG
jgi:hypothetical protein